MIILCSLRKGDAIGIVSPSSSISEKTRSSNASKIINFLNGLGFKVVLEKCVKWEGCCLYASQL